MARWDNAKMHLLILGATGKTGVYSSKYALDKGVPNILYTSPLGMCLVSANTCY